MTLPLIKHNILWFCLYPNLFYIIYYPYMRNKWNKQHYLYSTYYSMIARCYNNKHKSYKYYWWMWVIVCNQWLWIDWFRNFIESMWDRPEWMTLDRIKWSSLYSKDTCKRSTIHEQQSNLSNNRRTVWICFDKRRRKRRAEITVRWITYRWKWTWYIEDAISARKELEKLI